MFRLLFVQVKYCLTSKILWFIWKLQKKSNFMLPKDLFLVDRMIIEFRYLRRSGEANFWLAEMSNASMKMTIFLHSWNFIFFYYFFLSLATKKVRQRRNFSGGRKFGFHLEKIRGRRVEFKNFPSFFLVPFPWYPVFLWREKWEEVFCHSFGKNFTPG